MTPLQTTARNSLITLAMVVCGSRCNATASTLTIRASSREMSRRKTLLTQESQWDKTVAYFMHLNRAQPVVGGLNGDYFGIFNGTHPLVKDEDALVITSLNGMVERFGLTGVTSKGARLNNYHLPLRRRFEELQFPDDFTGRQWNDPAIGRYVADLRASRRSRVSAYSPAPHQCKLSPAIDTDRITCFGVYKSGRTSQSTRTYDHRIYVRFYPDASVIWSEGINYHDWRMAFSPEATFPEHYGQNTFTGTVRTENNRVTFTVRLNGAPQYVRVEGHFDHGRLWLTCSSPSKDLAHGKLPYRFHPFNPDAFL